MRIRHVVAAASGALLVASLAACGGGAAASGGGEKVQGGTIVYGHEQEPPCIFGGWVQQAYISRNILDSVVTMADDGSIKPWLATAWKISDDGLTYTFTLKPGVKFTDGTALDAQAVADNFAYWEKGGNSTAKVSIDPYFKAARAIDATHLEVTLNKPYLPLLQMISQAYFGIQSPTALKRSDQLNCEDPIGSGAFKVQEWKHGQEVVLTKNPDYTSWPATAKHEGPAIVDTVRWKFLNDAVSRYSSLATGETNVIYDVPTVNWKDAKTKYDVQQYITPGKPVSIYLNTVNGIFTDKSVRQAFAYGADRKAAVEAAFHGVIPYEGNPSVSQSTPGYNASVAGAYAFDQPKANELLDQAGWTTRDAAGYRTKDGKQLAVKFTYPAGSVFTTEGATVLQILQQQWKQVGFNVTLIPETQAETFAGKYSGPKAYDAQPWYWTSPSSAILWIVWRPDTKESPNGSNSAFYNNDQLSTVIQAGNSAATTEEANAKYAEAQQIIQDNAPAVGLYTQTTSIASARNLHDVWLEKSQGEPVFADAYFTK
ncbi:ABC transporter substrate-binding protein [Paractinoplanes globisporus]|uniref:ABC transporter substrate-binding protein n=1 Tax=Paractinoplanes globisporus TaxID=113565 RepID=A0ABW6WW77_9ACTN|nr:ABC transporter substrate-binding protein [Actinoplanes globisporus]